MGPEATLQLAVDRLNAVRREIAKVIVGQDDPAPREVFDAGGRSIRSTMELWPGLLALAIALNLAERVGGRAM